MIGMLKFSMMKFILLAVRSNWEAQKANPLNLIFGTLGMCINNVIFMFGLYTIMFAGKPENAHLLPYYLAANAITMIAFGYINFFAGGLGDLAVLIENADIDPFIATPRSPLLLTSFSQCKVPSFGDALQGTLTLGALGWMYGAGFASRVLLGSVICLVGFLAVYIFAGTLSFFMARGASVADLVVQSTLALSIYPTGRMLSGSHRLALLLSPAFITAFLPLEAIMSASIISFLLAAGAAGVSFWASLAFFKIGIRRYSSSNFMSLKT